MIDKCMMPRAAKKGERLTIDGVEYSVVKSTPIKDSPLYDVVLEPYVEPVKDGTEPKE